MSSITAQGRGDTSPNLRPLSILRDLPAVADLIELCFSDSMDSEGKRYIRDMRRAGSDNSFLSWAEHAANTTSLPLTGYIWEEDGRIVGNVSVVPFRQQKQRLYLIANVAVHPSHRRRGIARALTERAMHHAHEKNINSIWLHVREDNHDAVKLYTDLGFVERSRRTAWQAPTDIHVKDFDTDVRLTYRHSYFWEMQRKWLARLYPDDLAWHRNWNFSSLRPGFWNWLYLLFVDFHVSNWAAVKGDELQATLSWLPSSGRGDGLFAAIGPGSAPEALTLLLINARRQLYNFHSTISLDFPVSDFDDAIRLAGFTPLRTLLWMQAT